MPETGWNPKIPQNTLIRKPLWGSFIITVLCFLLLIVYQPSFTHQTGGLSYVLTMGIYSVIVGLSLYIIIKILRPLRFFYNHEDWSLAKEVIFAITALYLVGTAVYFAAFLIEPPSNRWNLATYWDSIKKTFLVGILPFGFSTLANIKHMSRYHSESTNKDMLARNKRTDTKTPSESVVTIASRLKKEKLTCHLSHMLYAEAEGNYTSFYLLDAGKIRKQLIRNTISDIEKQLAPYPFVVRTHRAYLVNLHHVISYKGNTAGYKLTLNATATEIPVSRNQIMAFLTGMEQYPHITAVLST